MRTSRSIRAGFLGAMVGAVVLSAPLGAMAAPPTWMTGGKAWSDKTRARVEEPDKERVGSETRRSDEVKAREAYRCGCPCDKRG